MGATLAYFQENPLVEQSLVGVYSIGKDGRVWVQTEEKSVPYKATLVTPEGHILLSNCEEFLRELARQSKLSQVTYYYTEDEIRASDARAQLTGAIGG